MGNAKDKWTKHGLLTTAKLEGLKPGEWASDPAPRGEGRMLARRLATGRVMVYFRYVTASGRRDTLPVGMFDARGRDGMTLADARAKVGSLRRDRQKDGDIRATRAAVTRALRTQQAAEKASKEVAEEKRTRTLGALLSAYADQLQRDGKISARSVRGELHHHVRDKWPKLWMAPIEDVTADDLLAIVAAPAEVGHLRQAERVRSHLRAAYAAGMKARHNAKALPALRALRVTANPARDLTPIEGAIKARDRALSRAELRAYWKRIQAPEHAPLRFHLLTGCQRVQQLARATQSDFDSETETLRLLDHKGRRISPRQHHVPVLPAAVTAMQQMQGGAFGPYVFTLTGGKSGADYAGIFKRVHKIGDAMMEDGELPGGRFTPGDLRRTVETRLAEAGISRDIRARLQSHGLSGVQERHYDRHDYLPETRAALETLHTLLTADWGKVAPIRRTYGLIA
ncbi:MAG: hypothetical protein KGJ94_07315 [Xanthomonadaceae bacterium]|nr:hypothetical protein [Xanthomonadaceae bacterium]